MSNRLYLDKFMTLPHFPISSPDSNLHVLPSLAHTGVQTIYEVQDELTIMPSGAFNPRQLVEVTNKTRLYERSVINLQNREKPHCKLHREYNDKVLLDMEAAKYSRTSDIKRGLEKSSQLSSVVDRRAQSTFHNVRDVSTRSKFKVRNNSPKPRQRRIFNNSSLLDCLLETRGIRSREGGRRHFGDAALAKADYDEDPGSVWDRDSLLIANQEVV